PVTLHAVLYVYPLSLHDALPISGGSLNLAKGQFGIFDVKNSTKNGLARAATLDGDGEYQIRVGNDTRRGEKSKSTLSFKLKDVRSEEHTSELQSRFDLVCRLLLE